MRHGRLVLEIDCAPGEPRPDVYAREVFNTIGKEYAEPNSKFFGNWTWFIDIEKEPWEKAKDTVGAYLKKLYNAGKIRYASWEFQDRTEDDIADEKKFEEDLMKRLDNGEEVKLETKIDGIDMILKKENGQVKTTFKER